MEDGPVQSGGEQAAAQQEGAQEPNLGQSAVEGGQSSDGGLGSARSESIDERYDRVFDRLASGKQKEPESPAPLQSAGRPETAVPTAAPAPADPYEKLDPASMQAMRQTGRLLPVAAWGAMAPLERAQWVRESKLIVAERTRAFEQSRQQNQQQQSQPEQQQPAGKDVFARLAEKLSLADDETELLRQAVDEKVSSALNGLGDVGGVIDQLQKQNQFLLGRLEKSEEESAFKSLEDELSGIPRFKTPAERSEVQKTARALLRAQWELGNQSYTLAEATVEAARSRYFQDLQQQAQLKLADKQARSLKGTMDRGQSARPQRAAGSDSREDRVFDLMEKGLRGQQLVDALR